MSLTIDTWFTCWFWIFIFLTLRQGWILKGFLKAVPSARNNPVFAGMRFWHGFFVLMVMALFALLQLNWEG